MIAGNSDELDETHEINVTPFIDVMLVLLVIFMVAAPLATLDVPVDLPPAKAEPQPRPSDPVFVTLQADGSLLVGETPTARDELGATLDRLTGATKDTRIYLRADRVISYGEVMAVMNGLREANYFKVALVGLDAGEAK